MSGFHEDVPLVVSDHAYWRSAERYPDFDTAEIETDVRAAMRAGRISKTKPIFARHVSHGSWGEALYAWSEDERRVYVLVTGTSWQKTEAQRVGTFVVLTVLKGRT